jgi:hypothetical protein
MQLKIDCIKKMDIKGDSEVSENEDKGKHPDFTDGFNQFHKYD